MKIPIAALFPEEIAKALNLTPSFRGKQIFEWVHKPTFSFDQMSNLSSQMRHDLTEKAFIISTKVTEQIKDADGSVKIKLQLADNQYIESVLLCNSKGKKTVCLSTQVGCGMSCRFCKTAQMGLKRNLTSHEIVEQFLHLKLLFGEISNIVFMGMGEPLQNLTNLQQAIRIFNHPLGTNISLRKITISTCGLIKGIERLTAEGPYVRLAFSLITADPILRGELMPVNSGNPLPEVKKALLNYQRVTGKRLTFEVVLLKEKNDRPKDIEAILKFITPLKAAINLIPWNKASGIDLIEPDNQTIAGFLQQLDKAGIKVTQRYRRGKGINAACGQLCVEEK
jgi:23S rRNA (adenine2503-C2)-methyltransferase